MKPLARVLSSLVCLIALFAGLAGAARAADLSHAVLLVASEDMAHSVYERTVILAAPLPEGGHIGIIINRPTGVKLETLFPDEAPTRNVVDQVYLGGPMQSAALLAVTRHAPEGGAGTVSLMPGLVAVLDGESVDRIIAQTPNDARYFLGFTLWEPDSLAEQIRSGAWTVRPADAGSVMPANTEDLWLQLHGVLV
jgi:putative transcriptional regulator